MKHLLLTTIAAVLVVGCKSTSIHKAAGAGNIEAIKQQLADGADVNAKSKYTGTPLHHAAYWGHKEVAELLIAAGADVNAETDRDGRTPLHDAVYKGHKEIAELLIAAGADVNAKDNVGKTPLDWSGQAAINAILGSAVSITSITAVEDLLRKHGAKTSEELKAEGN